MKLTLPWWLWPWHDRNHWRAVAEGQVHEIIDVRARLAATARECGQMRSELEACARVRNDLSKGNDKLRARLAAAVTDARVSGSALATDVPEFVMTGIPRGKGKRLQVSRDIEVTAFAMTEPDDPPPRWKLGVIMERMLVIDKPTYAECLRHLAVIWANADAENTRVLAPGEVAEAGETIRLQARGELG